MPSPQAVVTFVAILFVLLIALHVPLQLPAHVSAVASLLLAIGAGWVVNRRVPDEDDDVTEDARNENPDATSKGGDTSEEESGSATHSTESELPQTERGTPNEY